MKGEYETDRRWADKYMPEIKQIVADAARLRTKIVVTPADVHIDNKQATDLITGVVANKLAFASRLRRPGVFWGRNFNSPTHWGLQFTIRSRRDSGVETELAKILKGFADLYLYGHVEEPQ
jgi:hypothetical protein